MLAVVSDIFFQPRPPVKPVKRADHVYSDINISLQTTFIIFFLSQKWPNFGEECGDGEDILTKDTWTHHCSDNDEVALL